MASIDIIEAVRNYIGSKPIPKIDPNTQAPVTEKSELPDSGNGIIPALLLGFYKHTRNENDASELMKEPDAEKALDLMFADKKDDIINSIGNYAALTKDNVHAEMKDTISIIKEVLAKEIGNTDGKSVCNFFTDQRSNILKHLPVELNIGELVKDPSVDDRTNKMEGPMTGLVHTIEKIFSSTK